MSEFVTKPYVPMSYEERTSLDTDLYNTWNRTKSPADLSKLMKHVQPLIWSEVNRASGSLPTSALSSEAKHWAFEAIKSFDPNKGVKLSTHIVNYLPKVRRLNYKYQNVVRLPENLQLQYHSYKTGLDNLTEDKGREPSEAELAAHLGWSQKAVKKYKSILYQDLHESGQTRASEALQFDTNRILFDHLMSTLSTEDKVILDGVKAGMSSPDLAARLGVNINRLNYLKANLTKRIAAVKKEINMV